MKLVNLRLPLSQLLLDPNNYRLDYGAAASPIPDSEIVSLQEETQDRLEKERLGDLRDSILENGFLEIDRIVVRRLDMDQSPEEYVVVEGNRRTAALKGLLRDHLDGIVDLPAELINKTSSLNVVCIDASAEDTRVAAAGLMGIRHVSGPKRWTGYQSARLIAELYEGGKTLSEIASLLGISSQDAGRRLRGFAAFVQMRNDPKYGSQVQTKHYALLLEFLAPRKCGRKWLKWNDEVRRFTNVQNLGRLYSALVPGQTGSTEISNPGDAREFLAFLASPRHRALIEDDVKLEDLPPLDPAGSKTSLQRLCDFRVFLEVDLTKPTSEEKSLLRELVVLIQATLADESGGSK